MAAVTFRANQAGLRRLLHDASGPVVLHVANKGRQVEGEARRRVPVVSGRLRGTIGSQIGPARTGPGHGVVVFASSPYASWSHEGRRFDPRSGRKIFVRVGPRPFLRDALAAVGLGRSRRL